MHASDARKMATWIASLSRHPMTVTDASAGCGGLACELVSSGLFEAVTAVEINQHRAQNLTLSNMEAAARHHCSATPYRVIVGDYTETMHNLRQDVVFFDPPWGGKDYRHASDVVLGLSKWHLADIIVALWRHRRVSGTRFVVFAAPWNFALLDVQQRLMREGLQCTPAVGLDVHRFQTFVVDFESTIQNA